MNQHLGQLLIVGFEGTKAHPEFLKFLSESNIGGVILFKRNIQSKKQLTELIASLKDAAADKLFVSVDHEGGRVFRLPAPFSPVLPMAVLGKMAEEKNNFQLIYDTARRMGQELKNAGFNLNFAPVLDIGSNPFNKVIGDRAFGNSWELVAKCAGRMIQGFLDEGIIPCGKHFPGHGDSNGDSHLELPLLPHTRRRLEVFELKPFKIAIALGVPALMTAHLLIPNVDPDCPASLSRIFNRQILRRDLNFNGLIITDDLTMAAVAGSWSLPDAACKAVDAGADMLIISRGSVSDYAKVLECLKKALDEGEIPPEQIARSLARIAELKCPQVSKCRSV